MHYYCALLLALVHAVLCDYKLEVELIQYTGTGRLDDMDCCDLDLSSGCSASETCDVDFIFEIQNIGNTEVNLNAQTKGAGLYADTDRINFVNCQQFPTTISVAASNPLTFEIPSSSWLDSETLRVTITAQDYDPPVGSGSATFGQIGSPFFDLVRPSAPSEMFSETMTASQGEATISYRYRVICTDGSCGDACSETVNCPPWSMACDGISTFITPPPSTQPTSPTNQCFQSPSPCLNGGSCLTISSKEYECECTDGFYGDNCENDPSAPLTTTMTQTTAPSTATSTATNTATTVDGDQGSPAPGNGASGKTAGHCVLIVCALALLMGTHF